MGKKRNEPMEFGWSIMKRVDGHPDLECDWLQSKEEAEARLAELSDNDGMYYLKYQEHPKHGHPDDRIWRP